MAKKIALALAGLLVVALCFAAARHISDTLMTKIERMSTGTLRRYLEERR